MPALQADAAIDRNRLREELARRTGELQELETYTPLPPQPWGWLATDHFWSRALLTPIALLFWGPIFLIIFPLTLHFDVVWWQSALGFYLYYQLWGGARGASRPQAPRPAISAHADRWCGYGVLFDGRSTFTRRSMGRPRGIR